MSAGQSEKLAETFHMNLNVGVSAQEVVKVDIQSSMNKANWSNRED